MVFLLDALSIVIPLVITLLSYKIYHMIFVEGYLKKLKQAEENGDSEKAARMKALALRRQPDRIKRLFNKYGI